MISDHITILNQTILECLKETDEAKVVDAFTEVSIKVLGADYAFVWLDSYSSKDLELVYKSANAPFVPNKPREGGRNFTALQSGAPDFVTDVSETTDATYVSEHIKSFVIIPLTYKKNIYGTMVLCFREKEPFSKEKRILSVFIGNSLAQAITINRLVISEHEARLMSERQEAYFRALVENSHEVILLVDQSGTILYVTPSVTMIYGLEKEEVVGKEISNFVYKNDPIKTKRYIEEVVNHPQMNNVVDFEYLQKDGAVITLEATFRNMLEDENVRGIVVNVRDVTERKKAEMLKETERLLNEEKLKTEFLSNATHEIRTPLAIIRGNTDLALLELSGVMSPGKAKSVAKSFKAINYEVDHLSNVLSDLTLLTTKGVDMKDKINMEDVDLKALLEFISERYRVISDKKNIKIETEGMPEITMQGDSIYLEKLFANLVRNAITYGKEGGWIKIEMSKTNDKVIVRVSDNGIGIAEEDLPYIFGRFYRAEKSHNSDIKNTGLGLAIAKWAAGAHGGDITVQSVYNEGSVFTVILPLVHANLSYI